MAEELNLFAVVLERKPREFDGNGGRNDVLGGE
jgi:hypothetical protein